MSSNDTDKAEFRVEIINNKTRKVRAVKLNGLIEDMQAIRKRIKSAEFQRLKSEAVEDAWKHEIKLIENGWGTRRWGKKKQEELLTTGRISGYDMHHMKSVGKHIEYALKWWNLIPLRGSRYFGRLGKKDNEHTRVHSINPDQSTNGYFHTLTGKYTKFKDDEAPWHLEFKLKNSYLGGYAKKNKITYEEAVAVHTKMRGKAADERRKLISEGNLKSAIKHMPNEPEVIEKYFAARKLQGEKAAWREEQRLILRGLGTRQWTPKQQELILTQGRVLGFVAHSMTVNPERIGDVNNTQFLTPAEHLEAHGGDPKKLPNGFYDAETKKTYSFGNGSPWRPHSLLKQRFIETPQQYQDFLQNRKSLRKILNEMNDGKKHTSHQKHKKKYKGHRYRGRRRGHDFRE